MPEERNYSKRLVIKTLVKHWWECMRVLLPKDKQIKITQHGGIRE